MSETMHRPERYLFSYHDGDRKFAVAVHASSFLEAKQEFQRMSRAERHRNIVSTMNGPDVDSIAALGNWLRRTFLDGRRPV